MPASTLSRRSVALLRVNLGQLHFGRPINFTRKLHKNLLNLWKFAAAGNGHLLRAWDSLAPCSDDTV